MQWFNCVRTRYWMCILVHAVVVLIRGIMVVVWATKAAHRLTFNIDRLSTISAIMNFVTSALITVMLGLATWTIIPFAMHRAFTRQQVLTTLNDCISAWQGLGSTIVTLYQNLGCRTPGQLLIVLVYFFAAMGVGDSFSPSFTLEAYNETLSFTPTLNSITTALTKTANHLDLRKTQTGAALFLASFDGFPSLYKIERMSGIGSGVIYDTLTSPGPSASRITVPAIALNVTCGDVPQNNWAIATSFVSGGLNITVSATVEGRLLGFSGVLSTHAALKQKSALYKFLDEADPSNTTRAPSRNIYLLGLSTSPAYLPVDSYNSTGLLFSQPLGVITGYAKVIICSLTASNTTATVSGSNHAVDGSDDNPRPERHIWSNAIAPLSRGSPFEDSFSELYGSAVAIKIQRSTSAIQGEIQFSLFEQLLMKVMSSRPSLQKLETALRNATGISFGALGQRYPFTNVTEQMKQDGWDPKPTLGNATYPVLRARLKLSGVFTCLGFGASVIYFIAALIVIGWLSNITDEKFIGDTGLIFILSRLRQSSLPGVLNERISNKPTAGIRELAAQVHVHMSSNGQLDVVKRQGVHTSSNGQPVQQLAPLLGMHGTSSNGQPDVVEHQFPPSADERIFPNGQLGS